MPDPVLIDTNPLSRIGYCEAVQVLGRVVDRGASFYTATDDEQP